MESTTMRRWGWQQTALIAAVLVLGLLLGGIAQRTLLSAPSIPHAEPAGLHYGQGSMDRVPDGDAMFAAAELIVLGEVKSTVDIVPTGAGSGAYYEHTVVVNQAFKGAIQAGATIRVLRGGLLPGAREEYVQLDADQAAGPLTPGTSLLFLQPSGKSGVYQAVGHTQGEIVLDDDGKLTRGRGPSAIRDFEGMTVAEFTREADRRRKK